MLLFSLTLALEYEVACRAEYRLAVGLNQGEMDDFVTGVIALAKPVLIHFLWRPQLRDSNDEMVLEAAVMDGRTAS